MTEENGYELKYFNGKCETFMKFPGYVNISELRENMRCFLYAAGWGESNVASFFNDEEVGK